MKTSNSPNAIAQVAYAIAKRSLPAYRHIKNPKKFTQHQLMAILVLKEFFKADYRSMKDSSDLRKILELKYGVLHYTTLQKTSRMITKKKELDALFAHNAMLCR